MVARSGYSKCKQKLKRDWATLWNDLHPKAICKPKAVRNFWIRDPRQALMLQLGSQRLWSKETKPLVLIWRSRIWLNLRIGSLQTPTTLHSPGQTNSTVQLTPETNDIQTPWIEICTQSTPNSVETPLSRKCPRHRRNLAPAGTMRSGPHSRAKRRGPRVGSRRSNGKGWKASATCPRIPMINRTRTSQRSSLRESNLETIRRVNRHWSLRKSHSIRKSNTKVSHLWATHRQTSAFPTTTDPSLT